MRDPGAAELMEEAIKEGCDIVGGLPWYEYSDEDAREHIDICFDIAKRHDLDIHMLVDDTDDANSRSLEYLALKTMREGFEGRVAASHCGAMAGYNDVYAAKIVDMVATAGVTISVNAHINLVCSARIDREPKRRGIARVKELLARGANVVTSQDDVNDPYYPFGKPDPLECASMMAHVAQLTLPHELEQVVDMITVNSAKAARLPDYGIAAGCAPTWSSSSAPSVHEALRVQPLRRHVFKDGREVARSTMTQELLDRDKGAKPWRKAAQHEALDLLVRNGTLVIPGVGQVKADVGIAGGKIVALGENLTQPAPRPTMRPGARCCPASSIPIPISATSSPTRAKPRPRPAPRSSAA